MDAFVRQITLAEIGTKGQEKINQAKVLIIGAGGLGCPAIQYLAAAGIGCLGVVDGDQVSLHNLHRQVLYGLNDVGSLKVNVIKEKLNLFSHQTLHLYPEFLSERNAIEIIENYDVIIDGTDNSQARRIIEKVSLQLNKPVLYAGIYRFQFQLAWLIPKLTPSYSQLFNGLNVNDNDTCSVQGVLGMIPAIAGSCQAMECIKYICGIDSPLLKSMMLMDLKTMQIQWVNWPQLF